MADEARERLADRANELVETFSGGPGDAQPAITRNRHGAGTGWYLGTRLDAAGMAALFQEVYADAGITASDLPAGVEIVTRRGDGARYRVALNHRDDDVVIEPAGIELLTGAVVDGALSIPAGGVAVVRSTD